METVEEGPPANVLIFMLWETGRLRERTRPKGKREDKRWEKLGGGEMKLSVQEIK